MAINYFTQSTAAFRLFFALFIMVIVFLIVLLIGTIAGIFIFDVNIFEAENVFNDLSNPANLSIIKYFQIINSLGLFVIPPFVIAAFYSKDIIQYLSLKTYPNITELLLVIILIISAVPGINLLAEINNNIQLPDFMEPVETWMRASEEEAMKLTESFLKVHSIGDFLVNILMIAIIPAIGEELLFRGIIQKLLIEWTRKTWLGIVLTAIIFSAIHFQFYGFIPRFLLGMLFGYLLIWSKNIWLPIFAHFINNGTAVFVAFLISKNSITKEAETVGSTGDSLIYGVFSLMICGFLLFLLFKKTHRVL